MPLLINCEQGTPEWYAARTGVITASCFSVAVSETGGLTEQQQTYVNMIRAGYSEADAMAGAGYKAKPKSETVQLALDGHKVGKPSDASERYARDVARERISGFPVGEPIKTWVLERGKTLEAVARRKYETITGNLAEESGVVLTDDRLFGYSTDGFVGNEGCIEIKCLNDSTKIYEMLQTGDTSEFDHQMQGGLWITGLKWIDYVLYDPHLEKVGADCFIKRIYRNDNFIDDMAMQLARFNARVENIVYTFKQAGEKMRAQYPQTLVA